MMNDTIAIIILAAGKGTRMKSERAKVLHALSGRPMIMYVVDTAVKVAGDDIIIVIGNQADTVKNVVSAGADVQFVLQEEQKGTGHAVRCALPALPDHCQHVVILSGDVPLIKSLTILHLIDKHVNEINDVTVLGVNFDNPFGYGRIVVNPAGGVEKIVEETDASESERYLNIVNSGIYCVEKKFLEKSLSKIKSNNKQNEIYLTDIVEVANNFHKKVGLMICNDQAEVMGINTPEDLLNIETMQMKS